MHLSVTERYYKELRLEYLCLKETLDEFEEDDYNYDVFKDNGLSGFCEMAKERISELKEKMRFIEGVMFGLAIEENEILLPKAIDK